MDTAVSERQTSPKPLSVAELGRVYRLVRAVRQRGRLGQSRSAPLAEQVMFRFGDSSPAPLVMNELLRLLRREASLETSRRWRERTLVAWSLGRARLSPEQRRRAVYALTELLDDYGDNRPLHALKAIKHAILQTVLWYLKVIGCGFVLGFCFFLVGEAFSTLNAQETRINTLFIGIFCVLGFLLIVAYCLTPLVFPYTLLRDRIARNELRAEAVRALGRIGEVCALPAVLRASQSEALLRESGRDALTKLLPLVNETSLPFPDADLTPNLCILLWRSLGDTRPENLYWQELLLGTLEKVGTGKGIATLEKCLRALEKIPHSPLWESTLTTLVQRQTEATQHSTLLRGTQAPIEPELLLRPVPVSPQSDGQQLLRPGA